MKFEQSERVVAVISAVATAIEPARTAIQDALPGAEIWNLLDDRLLTDARASGGVTVPLRARMHRLIDHALAGQPAAVLVTCSLYGEVVRGRAGTDAVPVVPPDDAAFDAVVAAGWRTVLVIAPVAEALADSKARLDRYAAAVHHPLDLVGAVATDLPDGPSRTPEALARSLAATVESAGTDVDAVLLGQYSLAPAAPVLHRQLGLPVLSTPACAARRLAEHLTISGSSR